MLPESTVLLLLLADVTAWVSRHSVSRKCVPLRSSFGSNGWDAASNQQGYNQNEYSNQYFDYSSDQGLNNDYYANTSYSPSVGSTIPQDYSYRDDNNNYQGQPQSFQDYGNYQGQQQSYQQDQGSSYYGNNDINTGGIPQSYSYQDESYQDQSQYYQNQDNNNGYDDNSNYNDPPYSYQGDNSYQEQSQGYQDQGDAYSTRQGDANDNAQMVPFEKAPNSGYNSQYSSGQGDQQQLMPRSYAESRDLFDDLLDDVNRMLDSFGTLAPFNGPKRGRSLSPFADSLFSSSSSSSSLLSPLFDFPFQEMSSIMSSQQDSIQPLLQEAGRCLNNDIACTNVLGRSIEVGQVMSQSSASVNVNGNSQSRTQLMARVQGSQGS